MINKYIVVCPNCGTKLITVCSNAASDTYCPQCYRQLPPELYTKERNNDEALEIIANNEGLSEGFAETVVNQMANDDEAPHNAGSQLARAISCNDVNDALLALTGWSVDSLLDMVPPVVMDCPDGFVNFTGMTSLIPEYASAIVEVFENYLDSLNVRIPCKSPDEEKERGYGDNDAALYGSEYWEIVDNIDTFVYKSDVDDFIHMVDNKVVKIVELENYQRRIPEEIIQRIERCKGIFDKMYVVFTDYTKREERRVEAIKREKDPILFGTFQDTATRTVVERFYFIGDWTDEYCDLTLDKMVAVVKEKADRDIIKKFSTPESIRELSDQLNNLDESMNGLYRQREKAPAPKEGFFDRVRTAFRSLKGE